MAGLFSVNVTFTVFAVALPRVARDFHTDVNTITWVITAPLLAFGVAAPRSATPATSWGHKRVYLIGHGRRRRHRRAVSARRGARDR